MIFKLGVIVEEKLAIEKATADAFVELYNYTMGTYFYIVEYSDVPDIRCKDKFGDELNLEITLTEDRPKDIQAILGRSDHKSLENRRKHVEEVNAGKADPLEGVSNLYGNVTEMLISRIKPKLRNV